MRPIKIFDSICDYCDGKTEGTKMETNTGIVACTTCGSEDPDFVPFFEGREESEFLSNAYKARTAGTQCDSEETERSEDARKPKTPKDARKPKKPKAPKDAKAMRDAKLRAKTLRDARLRAKAMRDAVQLLRIEDTAGDNIEMEKIYNSPLLSDEEKRLKLCEVRKAYVKRTHEANLEAERWEREIREEEKRRAAFAKQCKNIEDNDDNESSGNSEDNESSDNSEDNEETEGTEN